MTPPRDQRFTPSTEVRSVRCSFCNEAPETVGELIDGPASPGCGLDISDGYTHTLDKVADQFGITPERVHAIESTAVRILGTHEAQS